MLMTEACFHLLISVSLLLQSLLECAVTCGLASHLPKPCLRAVRHFTVTAAAGAFRGMRYFAVTVAADASGLRWCYNTKPTSAAGVPSRDTALRSEVPQPKSTQSPEQQAVCKACRI